MIRLFLNNQEADIEQNIDITFSYKTTDLTEPTITKNSFSKTVTLKGTNTNNKIFGFYYDLTKTISDETIFDAKKRNPFVLLVDENIVEQGYFSLDEIKMDKNGFVEYDITLYGGLGDFFFTISQAEDGTKKTLADLYYGFRLEDDKVLSPEEEDAYNLIFWNKDYIYKGWDRLYRGRNPRAPKYIFDEIIGVDTYSGYYEDFDNDVILYNWSDGLDVPSYIKDNIFDVTSSKKAYPDLEHAGSFQWLKIKQPRDLEEHEVADLRSSYMRPAIKTSTVLDAISNPDNNGGYTIEMDEYIKNSEYYNNSYISFPRLEQEDNNISNIELEYSALFEDLNISHRTSLSSDYSDFKILWQGDTTPYLNPKLNLNAYIQTDIEQQFKFDKNYYNEGFYTNVYVTPTRKVGAIAMRIGIFDDDDNLIYNYDYVFQTDWLVSFYVYTVNGKKYYTKAFTTDELRKTEDYIFPYEKLFAQNQKLISDLDVTNNYTYIKIKPDTFNITDFRTEGLDLAKGSDIKIGIQFAYNYSVENAKNDECKNWASGIFSKVAEYNNEVAITGFEYAPEFFIFRSYNQGGKFDNNVFDTNVMQKYNAVLNKKKLLGGTATPAEYLLSFCNIFNAKLEQDVLTKHIKIKRIEQYYKNEIENIDQKVDISKGVNISPVYADSKYFKYGFETPETYCTKIYDLKNNTPYGQLYINTNYEFNDDTNDLFEKNIYKNAIQYRLNSIWFNPSEDIFNTCFYAPTIEITSYKFEGGEYVENEEELKKGRSQIYEYLYDKYDPYEKICCFDADVKEVKDINNNFLFYNGYGSNQSRQYIISDTFSTMLKINGDKPCYINIPQALNYEMASPKIEYSFVGRRSEDSKLNDFYFITGLRSKEGDDYVNFYLKKYEGSWEQNMPRFFIFDSYYGTFKIGIQIGNVIYDLQADTSDPTQTDDFLIVAKPRTGSQSAGSKFTFQDGKLYLDLTSQVGPEIQRDLYIVNIYMNIGYTPLYGEIYASKDVGGDYYSDLYIKETPYYYTPILNMPLFANFSNNESSCFAAPKSSFVSRETTELQTPYNRYWKGYIDDLYDKNGKRIEVYMPIDNPRDALKKFYFYKNCLWSLIQIDDWNISKIKPCKCTLVRVKDIRNYIGNYSIDSEDDVL